MRCNSFYFSISLAIRVFIVLKEFLMCTKTMIKPEK